MVLVRRKNFFARKSLDFLRIFKENSTITIEMNVVQNYNCNFAKATANSHFNELVTLEIVQRVCPKIGQVLLIC